MAVGSIFEVTIFDTMGRTISTIIKAGLGIFFIYVGVKSALFFHHYTSLAYHDWYIILSAIVIAAGGRFLYRAVRPAPLTPQQQLRADVQNIRATGAKYEVDLSTCRVVPADTRDSDGIHARGIDTTDDKGHTPSGYVIVCDMDIAGHKATFTSEPIDMELIAINFKMTNQKKTWLYLDPADTLRYYLDTRFLFQRVYH